MKLKTPHSLKEIADFIGCKFVGNPNHEVLGLNEIHMVENGDLVFVDHPKYYQKALKSAATTILIDQEVECPEGKGLIISKTPFDDYNRLTRYFSPFKIQSESIGENVEIDPSTAIFPNVFIGHNVKIGKNCTIFSGVSIMSNTIIGDNVMLSIIRRSHLDMTVCIPVVVFN